MNPDARIPAAQTIYSILRGLADNHADAIALIDDGGRGERLSYGALFNQTTLWGKLLATAQFAEQQEIGLLSENRSEWGIAYLAIIAAGKTVVPIDANLKPNEVAYIIDHANLKTVFVSGRFEKYLAGIGSDLKPLSFSRDSVNFLGKLVADRKVEAIGLPAEANECAVLIYTSGTTGKPKAVELTHKNILSNVASACEAIQIRESDIFLSVLPLHHTLEATAGFLLPLYSGATIVYARSLKSKELIEDIKSTGATVLIAVPLLFEKMYHSIRRGIAKSGVGKRVLFTLLFGVSLAAWKTRMKLGATIFKGMRSKAGMDSVRLFVSGGAALPSEVARFFSCLGFIMLQGYGLTETSPVIAVQRPDSIKFGSVGPPLKSVEVKIYEPGAEGIGEILVKGPGTTRGYRNNPEETTRLLADGWLHTGDLGRLKDGHLWITGRKKNVIVSAAGKNIYPEELEEKLITSLLVTEVIVVGRAKAGRQGEEVRAIVVPDLEQFKQEFGVSISDPNLAFIREKIGELIEMVNTECADFKRIAGFEIQLEELEKTSTKKVKRFLYK